MCNGKVESLILTPCIVHNGIHGDSISRHFKQQWDINNGIHGDKK